MSSVKVDYDYSFGWNYMPTDCLFGHLFSKKFVGLNRKTDIPVNEFEKDSSVLLIGNYWNDESVSKVVEKASYVGFYPMSPEDTGSYEHLPCAKHLHLVDKLEEHHLIKEDRIASAIMARTKGRKTSEDEYLYRGLCILKEELNVADLYEVFQYLHVHEYDTNVMTSRGKEAALSNERNAKALVRDHGIHFSHLGYTFCAVQGPALPVLDTTVQAAKVAQVGLNVRYDHKECVTRVSFYTLDPEKVKLDFVKDYVKNSGGREQSKGGVLQGIRKFPQNSLDDLLEVIYQKHEAPSL